MHEENTIPTNSRIAIIDGGNSIFNYLTTFDI